MLLGGGGAIVFAVLATPLLNLLPCQPTSIVIVVDTSGSMNEDNKLLSVKDALSAFFSSFSRTKCFDKTKLALLGFAVNPKVFKSFEAANSLFPDAINKLSASGDTHISRALDALKALFDGVSGRKLAFFVTDAELPQNQNWDKDPDSREKITMSLTALTKDGVDLNIILALSNNDSQCSPDKDGVCLKDVFEAAHNFNVFRAASADLGQTFLTNSMGRLTALDKSSRPFWARWLYTSLWTALLSTGLTLAVLLHENLFMKRRTLLVSKDVGTVVVSFLLGSVIGFIAQLLFELNSFALSTVSKNAAITYAKNVFIWCFLGTFLALALVLFKVFPNLSLWKAALFGFLGGLLAGLVFSITQAHVVSPFGAWFGALTLGLSMGLMISLLKDNAQQYLYWLKVFYKSDKVSRYHNLGHVPIFLGGAPSSDIYVDGAPEKVLKFWIEDKTIKISNLISKETRKVRFEDVAYSDAIELQSMTLKLVNDKGPEKGKAPSN
jgi:uncharacterized protein YegL